MNWLYKQEGENWLYKIDGCFFSFFCGGWGPKIEGNINFERYYWPKQKSLESVFIYKFNRLMTNGVLSHVENIYFERLTGKKS